MLLLRCCYLLLFLFVRVVDFYRALGCSVAKTTVKRQLGEDHTPGPAHHTATLKIPLNFPKPKKSHKKKT